MMRYALILLFFLSLLSCNKESNGSLLIGKLKELNIYYEGYPILQMQSFEYRQPDGLLSKVVINNSDSLLFNYDEPGKVKIELLPAGKRWIAYLTGEDQISHINELDVPAGDEHAVYRFVFAGEMPDSIIEPDAFPLHVNIRYHNILHDGNNYTNVLCSYLRYNAVSPALPPVVVEDEEHSFSYTSHPYNKQAVFQGIHNRASLGWEKYILIDPLYMLGLNGCTAYPDNTQLIASWNELQYNYTFNLSGNISQMKLTTPDPEVEALIIEMTYY